MYLCGEFDDRQSERASQSTSRLCAIGNFIPVTQNAPQECAFAREKEKHLK